MSARPSPPAPDPLLGVAGARNDETSPRMKMHWIWPLAATLSANRLVLTRMKARAGSVYLTFDDGPNPEHTPALLDLLKAHDARASFFVVGDRAQEHADLVARIVAEGHSVGNHSMTHPRMPSLSPRAQIDEIARADAVLARFNVRAKHPFRPPNGRSTVTTLLHGLWRGQPTVLWSIDSLDYRQSASEIVAHLSQDIPVPGDIVLFHDDAGTAREALRQLLPAWRDAGLRFESL